ncbi:MAG: alpha/beta hydrolase [Bacteroidetes bacterium]|nr:alpha/beta hydrolase [Bacteroidota bacterium]MBL6962270.1 alpha/beta hydrolase [Bacteroidota bacterium]
MKRILLLVIAFSISVSVYALKPEREYAVTPSDYGMDYNSIKIRTSDGMMIQIWMFNATAKQSRKLIILSDDGEGNMADLIELASNFLSLGYNVVTYDYRGYGHSDDFKINNNFFIYSQFQKDLEGVIDYMKRHYPSLKTTHLYGVGIGGGLSLGIGANRPEVSKIIADSPYITFEKTEKKYMEVYGQKVMMPLGFDKTWLEPLFALEEKASGLTGIFLISGEEDELFTPDDMKSLYKLRKSITKMYVVPDAKRSTTFISDKGNYFKEVKNFLGV